MARQYDPLHMIPSPEVVRQKLTEAESLAERLRILLDVAERLRIPLTTAVKLSTPDVKKGGAQ